MTKIRRRVSGGRIRIVVGLCLAAAFCLQCGSLVSRLSQPTRAIGFGATQAVATPDMTVLNGTGGSVADAIKRMAREGPLDLLREAQKRYHNTVVDYTCTFRKRENLDGQLTKVQGAKIKFRQKNESVYMHWTENPAKARRVIYVKGKWTKKGQPAALCEPEGAIARAIVPSILMPIHGPEAKAASRRTIDQFGFARALDLILKYSLVAQKRGELELRYVGEGTVDDRSTYVFERVLPYTGVDGEYPDRVLVYHLDTERLVPVMCASYADDAKKTLLGQYEYTDVRLNEGLTDADFEGTTYGL